MDSKDFKLLDKAISGLIAGQQEMSHEHGQTKKAMGSMQETMRAMQAAMNSMQDTLTDTIGSVERLEQASLQQEDRYRDLLDILRKIGDTSVDTQQRLTRVEERLDRLEDAG